MIITGLGFGDEGKGLAVSWVCRRTDNPLVIRFNGGHQVSHTVHFGGYRHVFSHFGAGSLQHIPTVWSHFCTVEPESFCNEWKALPFPPRIFIHADCALTTPFDIIYNRSDAANRSHGTVGVGFGCTIKRNQAGCRFTIADIMREGWEKKLEAIRLFYGFPEIEICPYVDAVKEMMQKVEILTGYQLLANYHPVYEGAQGILLDRDSVFFPHVTPSFTTTRNAREIAGQAKVPVLYVTRTYLSRHGNGPLPFETHPVRLQNYQNESNQFNPYQGNFRVAPLNMELLQYALQYDANYSAGSERNLLFTCCDQTGEDIDVVKEGRIQTMSVSDIASQLGFSNKQVWVSKGPSCEDICALA